MNRIQDFEWIGSRELLFVDPHSRAEELQPELEAAGWKVVAATDPGEVGKLLREGDYHMGVLCLEDVGFAEDVLTVDQFVHWIAIVSDDTLMNKDAQALLSQHFYDYHRLPVDVSRLATTLGHAAGIAKLRRLHNGVNHNGGDEHESIKHFVGDSPPMREIKQNISKVARKDFPVLICGESGTGKELIARAIHDQSCRAEGPFVAVNCGSIPTTLIQSELFGHEKGAFTGADKSRLGRFEAASGGTLFLDEIGDLSIDVQVNLLRVLEQGVIERLGDNQSRPVDVRIVTATNVDLKEAVEKNRFREDLYYRINVFQLDVPPLRNRGDDLMDLAEKFIAKFNNDKHGKRLSRRAIAAMRAYTWPGNVRELINRIQRAQISCDSRLILPKHLGLDSITSEHMSIGPTLQDARNRAERSVLDSALKRNTNNISKVARELAVSRVTLYRLIKKHNLEPIPNHGIKLQSHSDSSH